MVRLRCFEPLKLPDGVYRAALARVDHLPYVGVVLTFTLLEPPYTLARMDAPAQETPDGYAVRDWDGIFATLLGDDPDAELARRPDAVLLLDANRLIGVRVRLTLEDGRIARIEAEPQQGVP